MTKRILEEDSSVYDAIVNWWKTYDFISKDTLTICDDLLAVIPQDKHDLKEVQDLFNKIKLIDNAEKIAITIGNFVLRGYHQGQLHGFKEVSAKYRKSRR